MGSREKRRNRVRWEGEGSLGEKQRERITVSISNYEGRSNKVWSREDIS